MLIASLCFSCGNFFLSTLRKPSNCVISLMGVFLLSVVVDIQRRRLQQTFFSPKIFRSIPQIPSQFTSYTSLSLPLCFLSLSPSSLSLSQFLFCDLRQSFGEMECVKAGVTPSQDLEWIDSLTSLSQKKLLLSSKARLD